MSALDPSPAELLLAVDAGGTKTAACFARQSSPLAFEVLGRGRSSGANPLSVGVDGAVEAIVAAVNEARSQAQLTAAVADRAVLSIAGAADPSVAQQLIERLRERGLARRIAIVSDVLPILAAVLDQPCGIALIAGTGSVAYGHKDSKQVRCGGWGYLLGDEGSGYAIGRSALQAALEDLEYNRTSPRSLAQAVVSELKVANVLALTKVIYGSANPRATIATFARPVVELAETGDALARQILDAAGGELANLVARTAKLLSIIEGETPLALGGGVLAASPYLRDVVCQRLAAMQLSCKVKVVADPLEGCLQLASLPPSDNSLVRWS